MKPLLPVVDAVLFDLDGTLVETNIDFPLMKREMLNLARESGVDPDQLDHLDILAIVDAAARELAGQGKPKFAEALRQRALRVLEDIEMHHAGQTEEIPFARELVSELAARGIGIGIVTRNCRRASEASLGTVNIEPRILVCREDTHNHKPHPEPVQAALRALGARPESSIMVGDHLMDVQSGKAAGVKTIGVLRDYRPADFFDRAAPDLVARNLREVLDAIIGSNS